MKYSPETIAQLEAMKDADKYGPNPERKREGVSDPKLKANLSLRTNMAIDEFLFIAKKEKVDKGALLRVMAKELAKFPKFLEMDEREQVADYFEEIMDILGLESSSGMLENFVFEI